MEENNTDVQVEDEAIPLNSYQKRLEGLKVPFLQNVNKLESLDDADNFFHDRVKDLLNKSSNLGKFIQSDGNTALKVERKTDYPLNFKENTFIECVEITYTDSAFDFEIQSYSSFGKRKKHHPRFLSENTVRYDIKKAVHKINLIGSGILKKVSYIEDIKISGFSISDVDEYFYHYQKLIDSNIDVLSDAKKTKDDLINLKNELSSLAGQSSDLLADIENAEKRHEELETDIKGLEEDLKFLNESQEEKLSKNEKLAKENESLTDSKQQLEIQKKSLNTDLAEATRELKKLQEDKNAFTEDVIEFNRRSNDQKRFYLFFSITLIIIIGILASIVFYQAVMAATSVTTWTESFQIFIARIPLLAMIFTLTVTCFYLIRSFFVKIMDIDRQQLNFAKLGIVAKDVTLYASQGLDEIDEKIELEKRIRLKMDLLKDYLTEELGKQYDYSKRAEKYLEQSNSSFLKFKHPDKEVKEETHEILNDAEESDELDHSADHDK